VGVAFIEIHFMNNYPNVNFVVIYEIITCSLSLSPPPKIKHCTVPWESGIDSSPDPQTPFLLCVFGQKGGTSRIII
jgi:hypothetical protein